MLPTRCHNIETSIIFFLEFHICEVAILRYKGLSTVQYSRKNEKKSLLKE